MKLMDNFDNYIEASMKSWHCPGVAIAVIKEDDILYKKAFGMADIENKLSMTDETRFAMASITKSFTAMSIALLVDENKLEWDTPVKQYIPEFILNDPYITQNITVKDMLSHRTGLPRHDYSAWRLDITREEFIKRMKHFKFSASFREKFQYNNLMYYASAYLVEKVSGIKWEDFVHDRIFKPLMMKASNFHPQPSRKDQVNAQGYRIEWDNEGNALETVHMPFSSHTELSPGAAGALFSNLSDLIQWLKIHVNDGYYGEKQIISSGNLKQMHLPQMIIPGGGISESLFSNTIFAYGMGWFIEPYRGYTLIHHGGNVEGHSLIIGFIPQKKVGVIGLTNIASLPLRDILLYEGIDRALELSPKDWNLKYHNIYDPIIKARAKSKKTSAEERIENADATHPIEDYAGIYCADGYPDFEMKVFPEGLQARSVGSMDWSSLKHYHYNVFEWYIPDFDFYMKIRFLINDNGEIDSVSIPIEPAVENVTFYKKEIEISEDILKSLEGEYDPGIEGIFYNIKLNEGKVYFSQTGSTYTLIKPYKIEGDMVCFHANRDRYEFHRKNNDIFQMVLKSPGMTMKASKVILS